MFNINPKLKGVAKKGFSIVEIMVVLVIIAALSASVLPRFIEQNKTSEAKDEFAKLTELRSKLVALYDGELDYTGVDKVWLEQVPQSFKTTGEKVYSVWKNEIHVNTAGNGFKVTYDKIPAGAACTEFAKQGRKAGWAYMKIGEAANITAETTTKTIAEQCKAKTAAGKIATFVFVHQT